MVTGWQKEENEMIYTCAVPLREKGQDEGDLVSFTINRPPPDILVTVEAESMVPGNISPSPTPLDVGDQAGLGSIPQTQRRSQKVLKKCG